MAEMAWWETALLGALVLLVLLWVGPGAKQMFEQSREAKEKDWRGVLLPLGVVVLFILFLISLV